jgi:hypothetical protein
MSYSFSVTAPTKAAAKAAVAHYFATNVVSHQQDHSHDMQVALANANAVIDLLHDVPGKQIVVSCNGSLGWGNRDAHNQPEVSSATVNASAYLA